MATRILLMLAVARLIAPSKQSTSDDLNMEHKTLSLDRRGAFNFTLSWNASELASFSGAYFAFHSNEVIAYTDTISPPVISDKLVNSYYWRGRLRTFILHQMGGGIDFLLEISDLKYSDTSRITLRKILYQTDGTKLYIDTNIAYIVYGPPEECGFGLSTSSAVLGARSYVDLILCANPEPIVRIYFGDQILIPDVVGSDGFAEYTYRVSIGNVSAYAAPIYYSAWNSKGIIKTYKGYFGGKEAPSSCSYNNGECEDLCISERCYCTVGALKSDSRACTEHDFLAFAAGTNITTMKEMAINGIYPKPYPVIYNLTYVDGLDFNHNMDLFYYTDISLGNIAQVDLDGRNRRILREGVNASDVVAYDWVRSHLYWTNRKTGTLLYLDLQSDMVKTIHQSQNGNSIRALALRPQECDRIMFWTQNGNIPAIVRASMDDVSPKHIVNTGLQNPTGLAIDHERKIIYWLDSFHKRIESCDFFGNNRKIVVTEAGVGHSIQLFHDSIYWIANYDTSSIGLYRNVSERAQLVRNSSGPMMGLVVVGRRNTILSPESCSSSPSNGTLASTGSSSRIATFTEPSTGGTAQTGSTTGTLFPTGSSSRIAIAAGASLLLLSVVVVLLSIRYRLRKTPANVPQVQSPMVLFHPEDDALDAEVSRNQPCEQADDESAYQPMHAFWNNGIPGNVPRMNPVYFPPPPYVENPQDELTNELY